MLRTYSDQVGKKFNEHEIHEQLNIDTALVHKKQWGWSEKAGSRSRQQWRQSWLMWTVEAQVGTWALVTALELSMLQTWHAQSLCVSRHDRSQTFLFHLPNAL